MPLCQSQLVFSFAITLVSFLANLFFFFFFYNTRVKSKSIFDRLKFFELSFNKVII